MKRKVIPPVIEIDVPTRHVRCKRKVPTIRNLLYLTAGYCFLAVLIRGRGKNFDGGKQSCEGDGLPGSPNYVLWCRIENESILEFENFMDKCKELFGWKVLCKTNSIHTQAKSEGSVNGSWTSFLLMAGVGLQSTGNNERPFRCLAKTWRQIIALFGHCQNACKISFPSFGIDCMLFLKMLKFNKRARAHI